jgi:uncharacterized lipoprotein NlpE involved in copper resistance
MKKVLIMAALVMSLMACNNEGGDDSNTDTGTNVGTGTGTTTDTGTGTTINPTDTANLRDTSRPDKTRNVPDTGRRRSDSLR